MSVLRSSTLKPPELETQFRERRLQQDVSQVVVVVAVVMAAVVVFGLADLRSAAPNDLSGLLSFARAVVLAASVALMVMLRRSPSVGRYDAAVLVWMLLVAGDLLIVNATRPGAPALNAALDIMAIVGVYVVVPVPLHLQAGPALVATAGYFGLWGLSGAPTDIVEKVVVSGCFALAHILGILGSHHTHRLARSQYTALLREQEAKGKLERALSEIRVLKGIIPICSHCRKVRSDSGFWEQVEGYVRKHADVDFSHSICPQCAAEHYPDVFRGGDAPA